MDKLVDLKQRLENVNSFIQQCQAFHEWAQTARTKKAIVTRSKQVFSDWRAYALKSTPSEEMLAKVDEITERSIRESSQARDKLLQEIQSIEMERARRAQTNATANRLMGVLNERLQQDPEFLPTRQLDCLVELIRDGDVSSDEELAQYIGA